MMLKRLLREIKSLYAAFMRREVRWLSRACGGEITGRDLRRACLWLLGFVLVMAEIYAGMLLYRVLEISTAI